MKKEGNDKEYVLFNNKNALLVIYCNQYNGLYDSKFVLRGNSPVFVFLCHSISDLGDSGGIY